MPFFFENGLLGKARNNMKLALEAAGIRWELGDELEGLLKVKLLWKFLLYFVKVYGFF